MRHFLMLLLALSICISGQAQEPESGRWLNGKADGWFWYKSEPEREEIEEKEPEPAPSVTQPPAPPVGPAPLSSAWIREHMQAYLDAAIDNPTPENVSAFLYILRFAMDKSVAFMNAQQQATLGHPVFDEINRRPTATFANRKLDDSTTQNNRAIISKIRSDGVFDIVSQAPVSLSDLKKRLLVGAKRLAIIAYEEFNSTRPIANIENNITGTSLQNISESNLPISPKDIISAFKGGPK